MANAALPALSLVEHLPLAEGYAVRPLTKGDYDKHFLKLLAQLTNVGDVSREEFEHQHSRIQSLGAWMTLVVEHLPSAKVVASATLIVEPKFIHKCGFVGHIEDVVVDSQHRGKCLAEHLIRTLTSMATDMQCYKVVLDCSEENTKFYERCGFRQKEVQMRFDCKL